MRRRFDLLRDWLWALLPGQLGHFIPAGTDVVTWPSMNHRLPELWTHPERFDPERFAEPRSEHKRHRYAFAPFGGGAH